MADARVQEPTELSSIPLPAAVILLRAHHMQLGPLSLQLSQDPCTPASCISFFRKVSGRRRALIFEHKPTSFNRLLVGELKFRKVMMYSDLNNGTF